MIRSMTAFASVQRETPWGELRWELRAVNHRFCEVQLRLPEELRSNEAAWRERIGTALRRGRVDAQLRYIRAAQGTLPLTVNDGLLDRLLDACRRIEQRYEQCAPFNAFDVLAWPGVVVEAQPEAAEFIAVAAHLLEEALSQFVAAREREGRKLEQLILDRLNAVDAIVEDLARRARASVEEQRHRLQSRLNELQVQVDAQRLEQEVALLAQRVDVGEELDRLKVHTSEVRITCDAREPVGRRLDFLMQELHREANTLGSKAASTALAHGAVDLKVLIEQMREQVQNVE